MSEVVVRPYRDTDRNALAHVAVTTALAGRSIEPVLGRDPWLGEALATSYADRDPNVAFVAMQGSALVGYVVGCLDTSAHVRATARARARQWLPILVAVTRQARRAVPFLLRANATARRRNRALRPHLTAYPAHCHVNVAAGVRGRGTGRELLDAHVAAVRLRGSRGLHVSTATAAGKAFFAQQGFVFLARYGPTPWGDPGEDGWIMGRDLTASE